LNAYPKSIELEIGLSLIRIFNLIYKSCNIGDILEKNKGVYILLLFL